MAANMQNRILCLYELSYCSLGASLQLTKVSLCTFYMTLQVMLHNGCRFQSFVCLGCSGKRSTHRYSWTKALKLLFIEVLKSEGEKRGREYHLQKFRPILDPSLSQRLFLPAKQTCSSLFDRISTNINSFYRYNLNVTE